MGLLNETQQQISEAENKNRELDNQQSEYLFMCGEMLNWAMKNKSCAQILIQARNDMQDKLTADNFLKSL